MSHTDHTSNHHGDTAPHGTLKSYLTGFGLSVVLTAVPFWLVMGHPLAGVVSTTALVLILMAFAVVQMLVHMVYFLHLTPKAEGGWNLMALIFTLVLVVIAMSGSIWVMYHLQTNMMPAHTMPTAETDTTGEAFIPQAAEK